MANRIGVRLLHEARIDENLILDRACDRRVDVGGGDLIFDRGEVVSPARAAGGQQHQAGSSGTEDHGFVQSVAHHRHLMPHPPRQWVSRDG
jgi:hypothetical protein